MCEALIFLLDNIYIRFGTKLYRQSVGVPLGTNCAPHVADLFFFCYERDFMMSLSVYKDAEIIEAFNTTSRYLDDVLNINTCNTYFGLNFILIASKKNITYPGSDTYFGGMVDQIYPSELPLNKANSTGIRTPRPHYHLVT